MKVPSKKAQRTGVSQSWDLPTKNAMSRRTKIVLWSVVGVSALILALPIYIYISTERDIRGLSHWPHVPPPELFVTVQPKESDVVGLYELKSQTVTTNGLAAMGGKVCELELRADGTFSVTNYPTWAGIKFTTPDNTEFISTKGRWKLDNTASGGNGQSYWSVRFSETLGRMQTLELRSKGSPYDLMGTYGDADEGRVVTFGKVRMGR